MTISIITGVPGAGKTALAVLEALEASKTRPVYAAGFRELKIPHTPLPPVSEWTVIQPVPDDPTRSRPEFIFPPHSLVIVDEVQNIFPTRTFGSKVPDHVRALETHRHHGIDFVFTTQGLNLVDSNLKALCGRYIHLRSTFFGRFLYEWTEIMDPKSKSDRDLAARRRYKLPKQVFSLYKSATAHIVQPRRVPYTIYILISCVLLIAAIFYHFYNRINEIKSEVKPASTQLNATAPLPSVSNDPRLYAASYQPRIAGIAHTAQAYDHLTQPQKVPVPSACVASKDRCRCYTQDATPYEVEDRLCRDIVDHGIFVPFSPSGPVGQGQGGQVAVQQAVVSPRSVDLAALSGPSVTVIHDAGRYNGPAVNGSAVSLAQPPQTYGGVPGQYQAFAPNTPQGRAMASQGVPY